jgi:YbgC/YbaW family acyl-CoA thioester hydrolase
VALSEIIHRRRVQFRDTDVSGIVHFSVFFCYAEEAEHALWRAAGLRIDDPASGVHWPRVAASFEFLKPLRFEDEVDVHLRIVEKGPKTLTYQAVLLKAGEVAAVGSTTAICAQKDADGRMRAVDMPDEISSAFAATSPLDVPLRSRRVQPTPRP